MIATQSPSKHTQVALAASSLSSITDDNNELTQQWLPGRIITHHAKAGLNPLADVSAHLFSMMGKVKQIAAYRHLNKLQKELVDQINGLQETIKNLGYNAEYILVCRYALCATFDDIIANTAWGGQGQWDHYNLLTVFKQESQHQEKFFIILERLIKNPALYIDLMEFMYLCLSLGFKGHYRTTEYSHYQLEQITDNLYQHIRAYRGDFNKTLAPLPIKTRGPAHTFASTPKISIAFPFLVSACIILMIFMSFSYLLDNLSNDAYQDLLQIRQSVSHEIL